MSLTKNKFKPETGWGIIHKADRDLCRVYPRRIWTKRLAIEDWAGHTGDMAADVRSFHANWLCIKVTVSQYRTKKKRE